MPVRKQQSASISGNGKTLTLSELREFMDQLKTWGDHSTVSLDITTGSNDPREPSSTWKINVSSPIT